jgi:hypothetical protein
LNARYFSVGTSVFTQSDPVAIAIAGGVNFILSEQDADGTWGGQDPLNRLINTTHATMALQSVGFSSDISLLRKPLAFLRDIDQDRNVAFFWRAAAFLNVPTYEKEVIHDIEFIWRYRQRIGAHRDYPVPFFLLKMIRFAIVKKRLSVRPEQVIDWILQEWSDDSCWYKRPSITSMALALIYDMTFKRKRAILRKSVEFLEQQYQPVTRDSGRFSDNLAETCFVVFNLCERDILAQTFCSSLPVLVNKAANYILACRRADGTWDSPPPFGGITETRVYSTAVAIRSILAYQTQQRPDLLANVAAQIVDRVFSERTRFSAIVLAEELNPFIARFKQEHPDPTTCGFVMMRFRSTTLHEQIYHTIQECCQQHGLVALRADEKDYSDDMLSNIRTYMHCCGFGIAVFERLETNDFNPNISLEVGYMMAMGKPVCLLKDITLTSLHTDLVGRLYKQFDTQRVSRTIATALKEWFVDRGIGGVSRVPSRPVRRR